ncbi:MAG: ATP-binding protein [Candidatus Nanopelagicales bacterium]
MGRYSSAKLQGGTVEYLPRVLDASLRSALRSLPAVAIDGAKAIGKSATCERVARTVLRLDRPAELTVLQADRDRIDRLVPPVLLDEWQLDPPVWDYVRRRVDADRTPGRFILTGSANTRDSRVHSGAGRVVRMRMRPLAFSERRREVPSVSMAELLSGPAVDIAGQSSTGLEGYIEEEILASGFPGIRSSPESTHATQLDSYLSSALSHELPALGAIMRRPLAMAAWLRAYAAASSTTTSYESIAAAVSKDVRPSPPRSLTTGRRCANCGCSTTCPLGCHPEGNPTGSVRHPSTNSPILHSPPDSCGLAVTRCSVRPSPAERSAAFQRLRKGPLVGALFESLATLSVRVHAQAVGGEVSHLRTHRGDHEVDLIVEAADGRSWPSRSSSQPQSTTTMCGTLTGCATRSARIWCTGW